MFAYLLFTRMPFLCCFRLFLDIEDLEYSEENTNILGQGGSGTIIYRAVYKHKPVALKMFQIKKYRLSAEVIRGTEYPLLYIIQWWPFLLNLY